MSSRERIVNDIAEAIDDYIAKGYRLEMIAPADAPKMARLERDGDYLTLEAEPDIPTLVEGDWIIGRAGMAYRDLIPGRLGGKVIASQIRLLEGGPVADYVHYHKIGFQMIYCHKGRIRVVYQDQGEPFWIEGGDCILQPPEMRHRVLEATAGAEVIEVGSPAYHETWVDHDMDLPNSDSEPMREYSGQRFVRHIPHEAVWDRRSDGVSICDLGIAQATKGLVSASILRIERRGRYNFDHMGKARFCFVTSGEITRAGQTLGPESTFLTGELQCEVITAATDAEILEVLL